MPTCPDCGVEMAETEYETSYGGDGVRVEPGSGLLGALDLGGTYLSCYVCPECRLARFYAE